MSVQRYLPSTIGTAFTGMAPAVSGGDYVLHTDYAALEARCVGLERERDAANEGVRTESKVSRGLLFMTAKANAERDALQAKLAAAEEALKPSAETKADYIGEFSWKEESLDEYEEPCLRTIYVPWTTIKEIMKAIKARAALANTTTGGVQPKPVRPYPMPDMQCYTCAHKLNDWDAPTCRECEGQSYLSDGVQP